MSLLAVMLLLAQVDPPGMQDVWKDFARTKLPSATAGEDSEGLESLLAQLRETERGCRRLLADSEGSRRQLDGWRQERAPFALEIGTSELDARLRASTTAEPILEQLDREARRFRIVLEGKGAPQGLAKVADALPSLVYETFETHAAGWRASGTLTLFEPWIVTPLITQPLKAAGGRRSSELRLRIAAVRPGVETCIGKLGEEKLEQYQWFDASRKTYASLPKGGLLRPYLEEIEAAGAAAAGDTLKVERPAPDRVRVTVGTGAGPAVRTALGGLVARGLVSEAEQDGSLVLGFVADRELDEALQDEKPVEEQALAKLVALVKELGDPRWKEALADDLALREALAALRKSASEHWKLAVSLETFDVRRAILRRRVDEQGIGISVKAAVERLTGCGVELAKPIAEAPGIATPIELKGTTPEEGPHPLLCARRQLKSLALQRFERSTKSWKANGTLTLATIAAGAAQVGTIPAAPADVPLTTTRVPSGASLRGKLLELHAILKLLRERAASVPLGETEALASVGDKLGVHEVAARGGDRYAMVVFADVTRLPLWMDFTAKTPGAADLNLAPREKGEALLRELAAAKCPTTKTKVSGDSVRASIACPAPAVLPASSDRGTSRLPAPGRNQRR